MKDICYAGVGSRSTPEDVLGKMRKLSSFLSQQGVILRSGGSWGADESFESGIMESQHHLKKIFLPFKGFRKNESENFGVCPEARRIAREHHPNWAGIGDTGRDFIGRNSYIVLGRRLDDPVSFVVTYTPNGGIVGGTGQVLRIAKAYEIPIFNFGKDSDDTISEGILSILERS